MILQLTITNLESDSKYEAVKIFKKGGTIGRDSDRDWIFNDASNHISGKHAKIEFSNNRFFIVDTSSNGTFLNGNRLNKNSHNILKDGDKLKMSPFFIDVSIIHNDRNDLILSESNKDIFSDSERINSQNNAKKFPNTVVDKAQSFDNKKTFDTNISPLYINKMERPKINLPNLNSHENNFEEREYIQNRTENDEISEQDSSNNSLGDDGKGLMQLFLRRFGVVERDLINSNPHHIIEVASHMLHECMRGLIKISLSRKKVRNDFNFNRSMIMLDYVNPFKQFIEVRDICLKVFSRPSEGSTAYKNPVASIKEIFEEDLLPHDDGMNAGWQAVIKHLIETINPDSIEQNVQKWGPDESKFGLGFMSNKFKPDKYQAKCWRQFKDEFTKISNALDQDELTKLFKDVFEKAYNKKINGR